MQPQPYNGIYSNIRASLLQHHNTVVSKRFYSIDLFSLFQCHYDEMLGRQASCDHVSYVRFECKTSKKSFCNARTKKIFSVNVFKRLHFEEHIYIICQIKRNTEGRIGKFNALHSSKVRWSWSRTFKNVKGIETIQTTVHAKVNQTSFSKYPRLILLSGRDLNCFLGNLKSFHLQFIDCHIFFVVNLID